MRLRLSEALLLDLQAAVSHALRRENMVNIPAIVSEVGARYPQEAVVRSELEEQVMALALAKNAVMFFQSPALLGDQPQGELGVG